MTLPRNFAPSGLDGTGEPRTPDQTFDEVQLPPPPHHSTIRSRRPRIDMDNFTARNRALPAALFASDIPIPSIEVPAPIQAAPPPWDQTASDSSPTERLRPPYRNRPAPRTPPAQTRPTQEEADPVFWDRQRSASSCSTRSDTSLSSADTFISRPTSFGGSATSPECDVQDPFLPRTFNLIPATPAKRSRSVEVDYHLSASKARWTTGMDNHLWNVYQMYLADPNITPFKAAPGTIPPLGVCNRVARVARRTWPKATNVPHEMVTRTRFRDVMNEAHAVQQKTPKIFDDLSSPGLARCGRPEEAKAPWPDKNVTRRRLKELCRQKFSITTHYQRLRESRSPSPFTDQFSSSSASRASQRTSHPSSTSYATRDLGISLVASGATGPLGQLVTGESPPAQPDDWFNTPVVPPATENSPPPSGLGINGDTLAPQRNIPLLASPFTYNTWDGPTGRRREPLPDVNHYETISAAGPRLLSPCHLDPFTNVHKRRPQRRFDDGLGSGTDGQLLDRPSQEGLVFSGSGDISQRRIRLRTRGATLGTHGPSSGQAKLNRLFTPPTAPNPERSAVPPVPALPVSPTASTTDMKPSSTLAPPEQPDPDSLKRLGSPFELETSKRSNRSKSPRHIPSLSDPFVASLFAGPPPPPPSSSAGDAGPNFRLGHAHTHSIEERLAAFEKLQGHVSPNLRAVGGDGERKDQDLL